jgi:hypothetical protein
MGLVACSAEEAVQNLVDVEVDEDADLETEVTVEKASSAPAAAMSRALVTSTGTTSVQDLIDDADIDVDMDLVNIDHVTLLYVDAGYTAEWTGAATSIDCSLSIDGSLNPGGSGNPVVITETVVNSDSEALTEVTLSTEAESVINSYLSSRGTDFDFIASCDDTDVDTFTVTYLINIGVNIVGDI